MKTKLSILLLLIVFISSCAKKSNLTSKPSVVRFISYSNNPVFLKSQVENCSDGLYSASNTQYDLNLLIDGKLQLDSIEIPQLLDFLYIRSTFGKVIKSTFKNIDIISNYDLIWNEDFNDYRDKKYFGDTEINAGSSIRLCSSINLLEDNSIEGAAVKVNYFIDKTFNKIKDLNLGIDISPIQVNITPKIETRYRAKKEGVEVMTIGGVFSTDNAYYMPSKKSITFLPQSQEALDSNVFGGLGLWNIPMVPSHEYGHHIFSSIVNNYDRHSKSSLCFDNRTYKVSKFGDETVINNLFRSADEHVTMGSINEAFADLISFYTLDNNQRTLKNIKCMEKNRDIGSDYFANGTLKKFNKEVLEAVDDPIIDNTKKDCNEPDFQEIHALGAIFANTADRFMSQYTNDKEIKLKIILNFAKTLNLNMNFINGYIPSFGLERAYKILVSETLKEFNLEANTEICERMKEDYASVSISRYDPFVKCSL